MTERPDDPAVTPPEVVEPSTEAVATPEEDPVVRKPRRVGLLAAIVLAGVVTLLVQRRLYVARRHRHLSDPARSAAGLPLGHSKRAEGLGARPEQ